MEHKEMSKDLPKHWKEWTRWTLVRPKPDLTLAELSYTIGEGITEDFSRGATEFVIKFERGKVIMLCNKGGLEVPTGYNPTSLYKDFFKGVKNFRGGKNGKA